MSRKAFTLVELVAVVALLSLLTMGAVLGLKKQKENSDFNKALQCLGAIDQAKQSWQMFHPNETWPTNEGDRWTSITLYLKTSTAMVNPIDNTGFNALDGFFPSQNFKVQLGNVGDPCKGEYIFNGTTTVINRPIN